MASAIKAGLAYFAIVFTAGFILGALRVLLVVPAIGEMLAILLELPVILTVSWFASQRLIARFHVADAVSTRVLMGGAAFALLMLAETGLAVYGFGQSLAEHVATYRSAPSMLGLAGQILFGLFPLIQLGIRRGRN